MTATATYDHETSMAITPLADMISEILTDHPAIPRATLTIEEIMRGIVPSDSPDLKAWQRMAILIEAYAFLRVRGYQQQAAFIVVFNCGSTFKLDQTCTSAAEWSGWLETTVGYKRAELKERFEWDLKDAPEIKIHLKSIDESIGSVKSPRVLKALRRERAAVLKFINKQDQQPKQE